MGNLLKYFPVTDIVGVVINLAIDKLKTEGRPAVERMVTIKADSLRQWATKTGANPDNVIAKGRAFATAFADFVVSFVPEQK